MPPVGIRYLVAAVLIHWFIWGFAAMDRFLISYVAPPMSQELGFSLAQLGLLFGVLGVMWGIFSFFAGGLLSDRVGRKRIIIPATVCFSILSWLSGAVSNLGQLLAVRGLMGAAEGSYITAATATLSEIAGDRRRGFIIGLHQCAFPLWGGLLGALYAGYVATQMGWRWVFFLTLVPGLILALLHWRVVQEPPSFQGDRRVRRQGAVDWRAPFRHRNIRLTTLIMLLFMIWTNIFLLFGTIYLTEAKGMALGAATAVVSAWGIGAFLGMPIISAISDRIGRRISLVLGCLGAGLFTIWYGLSPATGFASLYALMFAAGFFGQGTYPLFSSIIPAESVPLVVAGEAIAIPIALGEIFGGFAPAVAGALAERYGLVAVFVAAGILLLAAAGIALGVQETARGTATAGRPAPTEAQA